MADSEKWQMRFNICIIGISKTFLKDNRMKEILKDIINKNFLNTKRLKQIQ